MINIFVFDTNSLISANLLPNSVNRQAYDLARNLGMVVCSTITLSEFAETLMRPKFDKYITVEKRLNALDLYEKTSQQIEITQSIKICRDPKDDKFLELAIEAGASYIITGDKDLLVLNPFKNIIILTAADFLKLF
jgi:uncharacterized protein